jgi:hypothetical protein
MIVAKGWSGIGWQLVARLKRDLDPALRFGLSGLTGLGLLGFLTFFLGLIPGGLHFGIYLVGLGALLGLWLLYRSTAETDIGLKGYIPSLPDGAWKLIPFILTVAALMAAVSILAPVDANEWDALAYHLAVPKLWISVGQIQFIPTIHHSNFPFLVDNLYIWGLQWGGDSGARAFELAFYLLGMVAIFGFTRQRYGPRAAWWATLAFATVPAVLWEAGTAYIDLAHGLYAGFGVLFAGQVIAESREPATAENQSSLWLAALMLAFSAASKYTGLQTIFAVALVLVGWGLLTKQPARGLKQGLILGIVGLAVASPWLIRNIVNVGNPVYPFFYNQLGGRNWDARRSAIYTVEQKSFGVARTDGKLDPAGIGHALLGLAYQPGRYVNPAQTLGLGSPLGSIGFVVVATLMLWLLSGWAKAFEKSVIATLLISALMWFVLSQQSRYIITWTVPLAVLAGGAAIRPKLGQLLAAAIGLQAVVTLYMMNTLRTSGQLQVVMGNVDRDQYRDQTVPFSIAARDINERSKGGKVALYDEVFGDLLDVPYAWANPGHSLLIPYDSLSTGRQYAEAMKKLGFTHIYISLSPLVKDREFARRWIASMGVNGDVIALPEKERASLSTNWETKWEILLSDAVRDHELLVEATYPNGILFRIP